MTLGLANSPASAIRDHVRILLVHHPQLPIALVLGRLVQQLASCLMVVCASTQVNAFQVKCRKYSFERAIAFSLNNFFTGYCSNSYCQRRTGSLTATSGMLPDNSRCTHAIECASSVCYNYYCAAGSTGNLINGINTIVRPNFGFGSVTSERLVQPTNVLRGGMPCNSDVECFSGSCFSGICNKDSPVASRIGAMGQCLYNEQCYSNHCLNGVCGL